MRNLMFNENFYVDFTLSIVEKAVERNSTNE